MCSLILWINHYFFFYFWVWELSYILLSLGLTPSFMLRALFWWHYMQDWGSNWGQLCKANTPPHRSLGWLGPLKSRHSLPAGSTEEGIFHTPQSLQSEVLVWDHRPDQADRCSLPDSVRFSFRKRTWKEKKERKKEDLILSSVCHISWKQIPTTWYLYLPETKLSLA